MTEKEYKYKAVALYQYREEDYNVLSKNEKRVWLRMVTNHHFPGADVRWYNGLVKGNEVEFSDQYYLEKKNTHFAVLAGAMIDHKIKVNEIYWGLYAPVIPDKTVRAIIDIFDRIENRDYQRDITKNEIIEKVMKL